MTPNAALDVLLSGHGAICTAGIAPCKKCEREHEATVVLRALIAESETSSAELTNLDARRREMLQLLHRMVKYAREDRAETPGTTRLARLVEQVADYLQRTSEPLDVLRGKEQGEHG